MTDPWVFVAEVAKHLGVAKDSVYGCVVQRGLPAHELGRLWKIQLPEIGRWARSGGAGENGARGPG